MAQKEMKETINLTSNYMSQERAYENPHLAWEFLSSYQLTKYLEYS